jgi:hypothetical protein
MVIFIIIVIIIISLFVYLTIKCLGHNWKLSQQNIIFNLCVYGLFQNIIINLLLSSFG